MKTNGTTDQVFISGKGVAIPIIDEPKKPSPKRKRIEYGKHLRIVDKLKSDLTIVQKYAHELTAENGELKHVLSERQANYNEAQRLFDKAVKEANLLHEINNTYLLVIERTEKSNLEYKTRAWTAENKAENYKYGLWAVSILAASLIIGLLVTKLPIVQTILQP